MLRNKSIKKLFYGIDKFNTYKKFSNNVKKSKISLLKILKKLR